MQSVCTIHNKNHCSLKERVFCLYVLITRMLQQLPEAYAVHVVSDEKFVLIEMMICEAVVHAIVSWMTSLSLAYS